MCVVVSGPSLGAPVVFELQVRLRLRLLSFWCHRSWGGGANRRPCRSSCIPFLRMLGTVAMRGSCSRSVKRLFSFDCSDSRFYLISSCLYNISLFVVFFRCILLYIMSFYINAFWPKPGGSDYCCLAGSISVHMPFNGGGDSC